MQVRNTHGEDCWITGLRIVDRALNRLGELDNKYLEQLLTNLSRYQGLCKKNVKRVRGIILTALLQFEAFCDCKFAIRRNFVIRVNRKNICDSSKSEKFRKIYDSRESENFYD